VLLQLEDVKTHFPVRAGFFSRKHSGVVRAVDGVSFGVGRGEVLGLVGESGCGKSTLARTIVRLVHPTAGRIVFEGQDLATLSPRALNKVRPSLQMIFQDPYASLNPRLTVFDTLAEPLLVQKRVRRGDLAQRVSELMERVGLAARFMRKYPHEFSGGQRQRIAIARCLALEPKLIIADEPVSALDVSVQAQILNLLAQLNTEHGLTMILVSHDLSVVHHLAHRIAVMYLGRIVEIGDASAVFQRPQHPYTQALISAVPSIKPKAARAPVSVTGDPPSPLNPPSGCPFHPRCPHAIPECAAWTPRFFHAGDQEAACLLLREPR
jgi:oligopeptide transport system ATP-binding protein